MKHGQKNRKDEKSTDHKTLYGDLKLEQQNPIKPGSSSGAQSEHFI